MCESHRQDGRRLSVKPGSDDRQSASGKVEVAKRESGLVDGLELPGAFLELSGAQTQGLEIGPDVGRRDFAAPTTSRLPAGF